MIWWTPRELVSQGRPTRMEMFWAFLALPILILQTGATVYRLALVIGGAEVSVFTWLDLSITSASEWWHRVGAALFFLVLISVAAFLLWACCLQLQRWWVWRKRR